MVLANPTYKENAHAHLHISSKTSPAQIVNPLFNCDLFLLDNTQE